MVLTKPASTMDNNINLYTLEYKPHKHKNPRRSGGHIPCVDSNVTTQVLGENYRKLLFDQ